MALDRWSPIMNFSRQTQQPAVPPQQPGPPLGLPESSQPTQVNPPPFIGPQQYMYPLQYGQINPYMQAPPQQFVQPGFQPYPMPTHPMNPMNTVNLMNAAPMGAASFFHPPAYNDSLKLESTQFMADLHFADDEEIGLKAVGERATTAETDDKLEVTTKSGVSPVQVAASATEVPCMVSLRGVDKDLEEIERTRPALDIVCVIDVSGSMNGEKIELARNTLEFLVTKLTPTDRLSLVVFDNSAYRVCPLLACTSAGRSTLESYIARLGAGGGTNIVEGLECGLKILADRRLTNTQTSIFLLSDGEDNNTATALARSQETMMKYRPLIRGDFSVHTFGYGSHHDSNIMCNIADQGLGAFHFVEKVESIAEAFADSFGGLVSQVAKNVEIRLRAIPGPVPCRVAKMYTKTGEQLFSQLAILACESKEFVFVLEVGPGALEAAVTFPAVSVDVRYQSMTGQTVEARSELVIDCVPASEQVAANVSEDVLVNFYRVKGAEILKEASALAGQNQFEQSRLCLQRGAEELRSCLVSAHPLVVSILRDLEDAKNRVRDGSTWRIGGAAQVNSACLNHYAQSASSNTQFYANPVQACYSKQFCAFQSRKQP